MHSYDFTQDETVTLLGFDASDNYRMLVDPPLSFIPAPGYVVDPVEYPTSTIASYQALWKLIHVFWTPSVVITSGVSSTSFNVGVGDAAKFNPGQPLYTHNAAYSTLFGSEVLSNEVRILSVVGTLVTVDSDLGYTPSAGDIAELIGFADQGPPYRWI